MCIRDSNKDGHLTGVYFSDSDDDKANGMQRYSVLNKNGHARVTTDTTGNVNGSLVSCITVLSTGETAWKQFLSPQPTELNLLWGETNFIYDGTSKKPELSASNIRPGDDVTLTVKGEASLVGTYTAVSYTHLDVYKRQAEYPDMPHEIHLNVSVIL